MNDSTNIWQHLRPKQTDVPDEAYFSQLAESVLTKQSSNPPAKVIPLYKRPVIWWSSAAAVAIIALLTFIPSSNQGEDVLLGLQEIPQSEIRDYIVENIDEFELDDLSEVVEVEAVDNFRSSLVSLETTTDASALVQSLSTEEIESYFESEGIDEEDLEYELFI